MEVKGYKIEPKADLSDETMAILDHIEAVAKIRELNK